MCLSDPYSVGSDTPVTRMNRPLRLGNDVVDLTHPGVRRSESRPRFLDRILSEEEQRWLRQGTDGWERRLWAAWAAKETAYKVACKWPEPRPVFAHATFGTRLELRSVDEDLWEIRGEADAVGDVVKVTGWASRGFIHLAGTSGTRPATWSDHRIELGVERVPEADIEGVPLDLEGLRSQFSEAEWAGVHSIPSAWARIEARRRLLSHLRAGRLPNETSGDVDSPRVEILTSRARPGRTPPRLLVDGRDLEGVDLSISHHGGWVGWALLLPPPPMGPGPAF